MWSVATRTLGVIPKAAIGLEKGMFGALVRVKGELTGKRKINADFGNNGGGNLLEIECVTMLGNIGRADVSDQFRI